MQSKWGCPWAKDLLNGWCDFPMWSHSELWSHSVDQQEAWWGHQRKGRLFQACDFLRQTCWPAWKVDPLLGGCSLSLPTWWTWGRKEKSLRSDLKLYDIEKNHYQPQVNRFCIICRTAPSVGLFAGIFLSCLPSPSCRLPHGISHSSCSHFFTSMWHSIGSVWMSSSRILRSS